MNRFKEWKKPKIKHNKLTKWNWMVGHPKGLKMGKNVDIGVFTYINAKYGVIIEDNVQIGSHCSLYSHDTIDEVIDFKRNGTSLKLTNVMTKGRIHLKKGCCIGSHTIILPGVVVEKNQLIKARSLLYTKL